MKDFGVAAGTTYVTDYRPGRTGFEVLPFEVCEGFLLQLRVQTQDCLLQPHELLQPGELLVLQAPGGHGLIITQYRTQFVQYRIEDTCGTT